MNGKSPRRKQAGKQNPESAINAGPDDQPEWIETIRRSLLEWAGETYRELPWRAEPDPYRVLVSEMMLVQTTVAAVIPYYERFLKRFPDLQTLAEAPEEDVLKAWEGLGYYRRAKQLQNAARSISSSFQGKFPRNAIEMQKLPGVGRYMAGAILSFAFNLPEPIVEANTQRVLARLLAWPGELRASATQARLWAAAGRLVPPDHPGRFNQALMDLGALVCTPRAPACLLCPLADLCEARRKGLQETIPVIAPKPPPLAVVESCAVVSRGASYLLVQRAEGGLWSRFWEFPTINLEGADPAGRSFGEPVSLAEGLTRIAGIRARIGPELKAITYTVTKHRVVLHAYRAEWVEGEPAPGPGFVNARWATTEEMADLPLIGPTRRLASQLQEHPGETSITG